MNIHFTSLELVVVVRCVRAWKSELEEQKLAMEARLAAHGNGHTEAAIAVIETDLVIVTEALAKLWQAQTALSP